MTGPERHGWRIESAGGGLRVLRCGAIERETPFGHGVSTRHGPGGERFDLRLPEDGAGEAGTRRRAELLAALGLGGATLTEVRQVHGARAVDALDAKPGTEADAIVAREAGVVAGVRIADCVPVLLADRSGRAAAAIHAGWRGVAARVVPAAVGRLARAGVPAADLFAGVGPSIGPCCYRVGRDCAEAVVAASSPGPDRAGILVEAADGPHLDLRAAVRAQLVAAGLSSDAVVLAPWCTGCSTDLLFSHRREGSGAGRMIAVVGRAPRDGRTAGRP